MFTKFFQIENNIHIILKNIYVEMCKFFNKKMLFRDIDRNTSDIRSTIEAIKVKNNFFIQFFKFDDKMAKELLPNIKPHIRNLCKELRKYYEYSDKQNSILKNELLIKSRIYKDLQQFNENIFLKNGIKNNFNFLIKSINQPGFSIMDANLPKIDETLTYLNKASTEIGALNVCFGHIETFNYSLSTSIIVYINIYFFKNFKSLCEEYNKLTMNSKLLCRQIDINSLNSFIYTLSEYIKSIEMKVKSYSLQSGGNFFNKLYDLLFYVNPR